MGLEGIDVVERAADGPLGRIVMFFGRLDAQVPGKSAVARFRRA